MTDNRLQLLAEAVAEANRFIKRANAALHEKNADPFYSRERSAAKRASLDLSRALATWRQAR